MNFRTIKEKLRFWKVGTIGSGFRSYQRRSFEVRGTRSAKFSWPYFLWHPIQTFLQSVWKYARSIYQIALLYIRLSMANRLALHNLVSTLRLLLSFCFLIFSQFWFIVYNFTRLSYTVFFLISFHNFRWNKGRSCRLWYSIRFPVVNCVWLCFNVSLCWTHVKIFTILFPDKVCIFYNTDL